jgi:DNA-binding HxlR family transcriptional regulator
MSRAPGPEPAPHDGRDAPPNDDRDAPPVGDGAGIEAVASIVGDRWAMLIVRDVFRGIRRFDALQDDLGVSRPILSKRLRRLLDADILRRVPYQTNPVRYDYVLTPKGTELSPALVALVRWGERWYGADEPVVLVHGACGREFEQGFWCATCSTTIGPNDIRSRR